MYSTVNSLEKCNCIKVCEEEWNGAPRGHEFQISQRSIQILRVIIIDNILTSKEFK